MNRGSIKDVIRRLAVVDSVKRRECSRPFIIGGGDQLQTKWRQSHKMLAVDSPHVSSLVLFAAPFLARGGL